MSLKTLPILFINMGGEMAYILDQRLQAQSVKKDKASRVLGDIVGTMFNKKFLDELFKPQELYSRRAMRTLFDKLAHASIMRLNTTSMDKLYDLMTMAVKYQLQNCISPKDILLMTLNHIDGIRKLLQGVGNIQSQIDYAYKLFSKTYGEMAAWELGMIRATLLNFYQDARIKVSMLLREKKQKDDGRFIIPVKGIKVPFEGMIPGTIQMYSKGKVSKTDTFNSGGSYSETTVEGSLGKTAKSGERGIDFGNNMYKSSGIDLQGGVGSSYGRTEEESTGKGSSVKEELNLLDHLLRPIEGAGSAVGDFTLDLFDSKDEEKEFIKNAEAMAKYEEHVVRIDASKKDRKSVDKVMGEMTVKEKKKKPKGDELLDLMDEAMGTTNEKSLK